MTQRQTCPAEKPASGPWLAALGQQLARWRAARREATYFRKILARPDDHLLRDMGLSREELQGCLDPWGSPRATR
ncbi:MAG: DUF1127 domain-containing protein [Paracoccaceae bacterium]